MLHLQADLDVKSPVKLLLTGGQPITKSLLSYVGNVCDQILVGYGATECPLVSTLIISSAGTFVDFSSGYATSGMEVKIVDGKERTVPVNTCCEIYVKSKILFKGYYNDKEKTEAVLTEDGWYKTDDLGRMLEDGSLMVEGRKSNMIISGGMNVAPEILETSIAKCPGVESVVLVPVPDVVMYQVICACVKPVPGGDVTEEVVRKFCENAHGDKLGLFTVLPKYYMFLDSFPETSTGKIARKTLTAWAEKTFIK